MIFLFWFLLALIIYCYLGYPLLVFFAAKALERPVKRASFEPSVSVIVSVYNEQGVIERRVRDLFDCDYPREKIEILVGSDGSTDRTNAIVEQMCDSRLKFFAFSERRGKVSVLNDLISKANNEI